MSAPSVRPIGVSSRARRISPHTSHWRAANGIGVPLPIAVDIVEFAQDGKQLWKVETLVDQIAGELRITHAQFDAREGLDLTRLQLEFRWNTPIEIVKFLVPRVLERGEPLELTDLPIEGFPDAAQPGKRIYHDLNDEFLAQVVWYKKTMGKGYARALSEARGVPIRTVISWMEKAKRRGMLR